MTIPLFQNKFVDGECRDPEIVLLETRAIGAESADRPDILVYVHREEKYEHEPGTKNVLSAKIRLTYEAVEQGANRPVTGWGFEASYSATFNCTSLTGSSPTDIGGIMIQDGLRGRRLGTYLLNVIVGWALQWPDAKVNSIHLSEVDGYEENCERRNRFYEQFGLIFDYIDSKRKSGMSRPMRAGRLNQVDTWHQNISVLRVSDHLVKIVRENQKLISELAARERANKHLHAQLERQEKRPIRTALATLWALHGPRAIMLLVIALLLAAGYQQIHHA